MRCDATRCRGFPAGSSTATSNCSESSRTAACSSRGSGEPLKRLKYLATSDGGWFLMFQPVDCNFHATSPTAGSCSARCYLTSRKFVPLSSSTCRCGSTASSSSCKSARWCESEWRFSGSLGGLKLAPGRQPRRSRPSPNCQSWRDRRIWDRWAACGRKKSFRSLSHEKRFKSTTDGKINNWLNFHPIRAQANRILKRPQRRTLRIDPFLSHLMLSNSDFVRS